MEFQDDDLSQFDANGAPPLPAAGHTLAVETHGARIWAASFGAGPAVILLHGGLGNSGNWGYQVPALVGAGYRAIVIDSRGHGRSSRDAEPFSYEGMSRDVQAVMDHLGIASAAVVGWSDGACTGLILAHRHPERVAGVLFFACNMDPSGARPFVPSPVIDHCLARHVKDYAALSPTPDDFEPFSAAVSRMQQTQPNYSAADLGDIAVPVAIVQSESDEFIFPEHARYLAQSIPGATLTLLEGVSHFAPLQRPGLFNATMLGFLAGLDRR